MNEIEITFCNWNDFLSITAHAIQMTISASFTFPSKVLIALQPMNIVIGFYPSLVGIRKDIHWFCFAYFSNPYLIGILLAIHLLNEKLIAFRNELHARNVIVTRISWHDNPCSLSTISRNITHLYSRIGCTCLRIRKTMNSRINGIYIVDNIKPTCTVGIALPISNVFAIRTPTETITTIKFFLIHPVKGTVHNLFIAILGKLNYLTISQSFYINIIF